MNDCLKADCAQCVALCCVALAFDRSELFALSKQARSRCRHLNSQRRCSIHSIREQRGFGGCIRYDCLGAGQAVTRLFHPGVGPHTTGVPPAMLSAFVNMRAVHERLQLLHASAGLPLSESDACARHGLIQALLVHRTSLARLEDFESSDLSLRVQHFLRSLRKYGSSLRQRRHLRVLCEEV